MKIFKIIYILSVVSLIVISAGACNKDKNLPDTKQENDFQLEKPIEDDKSAQDNTESEEQETPVTFENDETDDENDANNANDNDETNDTDENNETDEITENQQEDDILSETDAKVIIEATAEQVIKAISEKDAAAISEFVHPVKGLRFTPYTFVSLERDIVFTKEDIKGFFEDSDEYLWGYYDGIGDEIKLTPSEYYDKFIYSEDFKNAPEVGYNKVLSFGNVLENQFEVYEKPIVVEYYFPGFDEQYEGMDWRSLRLVFEQYEDSWKLVGIIHNQWTI